MLASSLTSQGRTRSAPSLIGQRLHPLEQRLALIGEGKLGALAAARLRDAPGDGAVVGDAHDQAALARHKPAPIAHENPAKAFENKLKAARASYSIEAGGQRAPARNGLAASQLSFSFSAIACWTDSGQALMARVRSPSALRRA